MNIEAKDYLLIELNNRKHLVQVLDVRKKHITVVLDNVSRAHASTQQSFQLDPSTVLANLGKEPYFGTAFGVQIEPYVQHTTLKPWGDIYWFIKPTPKQISIVERSLTTVADALKGYDLLSKFPVDVHIANPKGLMQGQFRHYRKSEKKESKTDEMILRPHEISRKDLTYVAFHEVAHYIEFNLFDTLQTKRWINLYHRNVVLTSITKKHLDQLYSDFTVSNDTVTAFGKSLDEESIEAKVWGLILDFIDDYHKISKKNLNVLVGNDHSVIKKFWPTEMQMSEMVVSITEYANKNPSEFWAEAFAFLNTGEKLNPRIAKAVGKTLKELAGK